MKSSFDFDSLSIPVEHQVRISTLNTWHNSDCVPERTSLLCTELQTVQPDILCLQEVIFEPDGSSLQLKNITHGSELNIITALQQTPSDYHHCSGTAILSSLHPVESGSFPLGTPTATNDNASYAVLEHASGRAIIVITAHLHWGGDKERERLVQLTSIDSEAKKLAERYSALHPMVLLTGDFNTVTDGDAMRFLRGLGSGSDGSYTRWTDAWESSGTPENEVTSSPQNHWAQNTARSVGIQLPHMLPHRRIDYIMSLGWNYGNAGAALRFERGFDSTAKFGFSTSDHYGLTADFWAPPVPV